MPSERRTCVQERLGHEMQKRSLRDLQVSSIGLGCMGMSAFYGSTDQEEGIATIRRAVPTHAVMWVSWPQACMIPLSTPARLVPRAWLAKGRPVCSSTGSASMSARSRAVPAEPVNRLLSGIFAAERWWLGRLNLPFGVSLFAVLGDLFEPKTFGGLFGAAPSVALATLALSIHAHGAAYGAASGTVVEEGGDSDMALVLVRLGRHRHPGVVGEQGDDGVRVSVRERVRETADELTLLRGDREVHASGIRPRSRVL